jgi:catechol 2,3-dioxygenase-like lactoylglutathione lyase family enzyme
MSKSASTLALPPIDQVGFVVSDLDQAVARYEALYGPFTFMDAEVSGADFHGRKADCRLRIAFGHSGPLEIEFIQPVEGESPHAEFLAAGGEGMHHLRYRVEDTDAWIEKVAPLGYKPIWYKQFSADTVFAYLEREGDPLLIEFLQMPEGGPGTS